MVIAQSDNKFYAIFIDELRMHAFPYHGNKEFREYVKTLNPNYPVDNTTGKYVSFAKISMIEFRKHLSFLKVIACKYGMYSEYLDDVDHDVAKTSLFKASVFKIEKNDENSNIVYVICSRCGSSTKRMLSRDRLQELLDIEEGEESETMDPISKSFLCCSCVSSPGVKRDVQERPG